MALQGTLKDFSVVDIFQLLGQQGKSGSLVIITPTKEETHIVFEKGNIVLARFVKGHEDLRLGNMLYAAGIITKNQLNTALEEHQRVMKSLGDVLIGQKYISLKTLSAFINLQTREVIFRILQWKSGVYKFKGGQFNYNKRVIQPISTDFILMDAVRQIDEWPAIFESVGPLESVYDLTPAGREALSAVESGSETIDSGGSDIDAAFAEFDEESGEGAKAAKEVNLEKTEKQVLRFVNGRRSVLEIISRSRTGRFEGCRALDLLSSKEFIQKLEGVRAASGVTGQYQSESFGSPVKLPIIQVLFSIGLLALLAILILTIRPIIIVGNPDRSVATLGKAVADQDAAVRFLSHCRVEQIQKAVHLYLIENLSYPDNIAQLVKEGILSDKDFKEIEASKLHYVKSLDSFVLLAPPY